MNNWHTLKLTFLLQCDPVVTIPQRGMNVVAVMEIVCCVVMRQGSEPLTGIAKRKTNDTGKTRLTRFQIHKIVK